MAKVFISYCSKNRELVEAFMEFLQLGMGVHRSDIFCTVYSEALPTGTDFIAKIREQLRECTAVISLITEEYLKSPFCIAPVKTCLSCLLLHFLRTHQRGKLTRHFKHGFTLLFYAFCFPFDFIPSVKRFCAVCRRTAAEYMGMPFNQFLAKLVYNIVEIKRTLFTFHLTMEHDLKQHITEFLTKALRILFIDRFNRLISFLYKILFYGFVSLLPIPRAAAG